MKYVKMLGLLAVAAAALMAFAGTASATTITSDSGVTPTITASGTNTALHAGDSTSFLTVSCHSSTVSGPVTTHGGASSTVSGDVSTLTFTNCTNGTVTVSKGGTLEVHSHPGEGQTGNGILTSSGAEITIHTSAGPTCLAKTANTQIGTVTGAATGKNAVLDIGSSNIPLSGFLCPSFGVWTGNYTTSSPTGLTVH